MISAPHLGHGVGLLLLVTGCPVLDVAVEVQEACLTYPEITIEGAAGTPSVTRSFVFEELAGLHALVEHHAVIEFSRAGARATGGVSDFGFIDSARVTMASGDPASKLPALTVFRCDGDCARDGDQLAIPASVRQSAIEYLATDSILVDLTITGRLPSARWTMDVDICMSGKIDYALEP